MFRTSRFSHARLLRAAVLLTTLLGGAAQAQTRISLDAGTTGVGGHLSGYLSHKFDGSTSTIDYNINGKLRSADALLDWFPAAGSGFRVSAGAVYDANQFDVTGKPSAGRYLINGVSYAATDVGVLSGAVEYGKLAPYLGIGYGSAPATTRGWGFAADLGGYYQGKGKSRLNSVGCKAAAPICQAIASDVAVEQAHLADKISDVPSIYPVLRVSVAYTF